MAEITVTLPAEVMTWRPTAFPGSDASRSIGCTCPRQAYRPGVLVFEDTCPVHTEEVQNGWIQVIRATVR